MIAALIVLVLLALAWAAREHFTHRKTRLALAKSLERVEDLSALCDSQIEFLRDVQPIYAATLKVRDETKNVDRLMLSRAEVARRNVQTMLAQLPPLMPQEMPREVAVPAPPVTEVSANG